MKNSERAAYFYDLEVASKTTGVGMPTMSACIDAIEHVYNSNNASIPINHSKARIKIRDIKRNQREQYSTFLIAYSDTMAPNAVYSDLDHDAYQEYQKKPGEGNEYGAHIVISEERDPTSGNYLALSEGVYGLSHSIIRRALNTYINRYTKTASKHFSSTLLNGERKRDGTLKTKTFLPRFDFHGHFSDDFIYQIENGTVQTISLYESQLQSSLGASQYLSIKESEVKIRVDGKVPSSGRWGIISKDIADYAKNNNINKAKIRFKQVDGLPQTVEIDPITGTPVSQSFIKSRIYKNITPFLSQSSESIVEHFANLMAADLLATR